MQITLRGLVISCLVSLLLGMPIGWSAAIHFQKHVVKDPIVVKVPELYKVDVAGKDTTHYVIQQVPKEVDPSTGKKESTDAEIVQQPVTFTWSFKDLATGKTQQMPFKVTSDFNTFFKDNKWQVVTTQTFNGQITADIPIQKVDAALALRVGKHSYGPDIQVGRLGVYAGKEWGQPSMDWSVKWDFIQMVRK